MHTISRLVFVTLVALAAACSPKEIEIIREIVATREVPITVEVTREVEVPITAEMTREVEVPITAEVTRQAEVPTTVEVTREVPVTVEVTRIVEVTPRPTSAPTPRPLVEAGESVQYGRWEYSIAEVRRAKAMSDSFGSKYAGGVFIVVFLQIKNLGSIAERFDEEFLVLEDATGRLFTATESLLAHHYYRTQYWYLDDFQPGGVYVITLAYDVADDAQGLVLRPADSPIPAIRLP